MRYFVFNEKDSRLYFELTNSIKRPYLPTIEVPTINIPNRAGAVGLRKNQIGVRNFEMTVTMLAYSHLDLRQKVRKLAEFLIYEEDKKLIFSDEPDKFYWARFNQSSTDLEEIAQTGEGTLAFTAFDPFAYANIENTRLIAGVEDTFVNNGTAPLYPRFRMFSYQENAFIKITNVTTGKMLLYNAPWSAQRYLTFDTATNQVYEETAGKRGTNFIKNLALESEFFPFVQGANIIRVENQNIDGTGVAGQLRVYWRERFY